MKAKQRKIKKWQCKYFFSILCLFPFILLAKSEIRYAFAYENKQQYWVNVISKIELTKETTLALKKGMQLVFNYELILQSKEPWYWKDKKAFKKIYIVSYNQTINRFEMENPKNRKRKEFFNLKSLIKEMEFLSNFPLGKKKKLDKNKAELKVRFVLDKEKLPSIIRLESLFKKDWDIDSGWTTWQLP